MKKSKDILAKRAAYQRAWYARNRERGQELSRQNAAKHFSKRKEQKDRWRANNLKRHNKNSAAWKKANPGKAHANTVARRARKLKATPAWLTEEQHEEMRNIYVVANLVHMEVDHRVPLRGDNVCGLHVPWNLQLLSRELNQAKGNRCLA